MREVIAGSRILWEVGDAFTSRAVTAYQALQVEAALADASRRAAVVRDLLRGRLPEDPAAYGLDPEREYAVVRCRVPSGASGEQLRSHLERTGGGEAAGALVVLDDNECLVASLGWRIAAVHRGDVLEAYRARFLDPVREQGAFGDDIMVALRAWLRHGRSIPRAAPAPCRSTSTPCATDWRATPTSRVATRTTWSVCSGRWSSPTSPSPTTGCCRSLQDLGGEDGARSVDPVTSRTYGGPGSPTRPSGQAKEDRCRPASRAPG